jgi:hypothetical protein
MRDHTLYFIHASNGVAQYAGHVILWETSEFMARSIAQAMLDAEVTFGETTLKSPIVGVEVVRNGDTFVPGVGREDEPVCTLGMTLEEAEASA